MHIVVSHLLPTYSLYEARWLQLNQLRLPTLKHFTILSNNKVTKTNIKL